MKTIKFYTLGCKVNQYDTQVIREQFLRYGFQEIQNGQKADVYVINTCTVTRTADDKSRYYIRYAWHQNPKAKIMVTGCYAELDSDVISKISGVTHIVKNQDKGRIVELLNESILRQAQDTSPKDTERNRSASQRVNEQTGITGFHGHSRAFLKIQDGCNNFCSYCKVPLVRGSSRSKPLNEIIKEARKLVKAGFREIVLCGVCLGAYGKDSKPLKTNLVDAIGAIEKIDGLLRIRLSSIEAGDVSGELINKMNQSGIICRHLHIPIQSGDDQILKKMNRSYSCDDYINLIQRTRRHIPEIAITTDVLVGFPGEREDNFSNTISLIKKISPLRTHIFPYSPREGTNAFCLKDKVSPITVRQRILQLKDIAQECSRSYRRRFLNKDMAVLVEGRVNGNKCLWQGYTDNYIKVVVASGQDLKNQLLTVKLKQIIGDRILADFC
jgi:threonylcarbamoyladenosine tRNA methylthiotransferase MtaB